MRVSSITGTVLAVIGMAGYAGGDEWRLPTEAKFYSSNKQFRVDVVPRPVESQLQYFTDKVEGNPKPGMPPRSKLERPHATFRTRRWWGYAEVRSFPLVNEVAPVSAIVSSSGQYLVTFDNWHGLGYGNDVVVIYHTTGDLIAHLGLEDFLVEGDIDTLPRSVSSILWGGEHRIDEAKAELVLQIVSNGITSDRTAQFAELRIDLVTGRLLEPKRERFPQLRVVVQEAPPFVPNLAEDTPPVLANGGPAPDSRRCNAAERGFDTSGAVVVPSDRMFTRATSKVASVYPAIARAARVQDSVVVEVTVNAAGAVRCARAVSGSWLLRYAAVEAALQWRFTGLVPEGVPTAIGWIAFDFRARTSPAP
jgi:TonB family protein